MASSLQFGSSWATACFVESSKNNKLDWKRTLQPSFDDESKFAKIKLLLDG